MFSSETLMFVNATKFALWIIFSLIEISDLPRLALVIVSTAATPCRCITLCPPDSGCTNHRSLDLPSILSEKRITWTTVLVRLLIDGRPWLYRIQHHAYGFLSHPTLRWISLAFLRRMRTPGKTQIFPQHGICQYEIIIKVSRVLLKKKRTKRSGKITSNKKQMLVYERRFKREWWCKLM